MQMPVESRRGALYPLGLKLHTVVSHSTWVLRTSSRTMFSTADPLPGLLRLYIINPDVVQGFLGVRSGNCDCLVWLDSYYSL